MPGYRTRGHTSASQEVERFVVRLPAGMRSRIADAASQSHRSMNSEIVSRLEESLENTEHHPQQLATTHQNTRPPELRSVGASAEAAREQESRLLQAYYQLPRAKRESLLRFLEELSAQ